MRDLRRLTSKKEVESGAQPVMLLATKTSPLKSVLHPMVRPIVDLGFALPYMDVYEFLLTISEKDAFGALKGAGKKESHDPLWPFGVFRPVVASGQYPLQSWRTSGLASICLTMTTSPREG
jgi:hypothetical protein